MCCTAHIRKDGFFSYCQWSQNASPEISNHQPVLLNTTVITLPVLWTIKHMLQQVATRLWATSLWRDHGTACFTHTMVIYLGESWQLIASRQYFGIVGGNPPKITFDVGDSWIAITFQTEVHPSPIMKLSYTQILSEILFGTAWLCSSGMVSMHIRYVPCIFRDVCAIYF